MQQERQAGRHRRAVAERLEEALHAREGQRREEVLQVEVQDDGLAHVRRRVRHDRSPRHEAVGGGLGLEPLEHRGEHPLLRLRQGRLRRADGADAAGLLGDAVAVVVHERRAAPVEGEPAQAANGDADRRRELDGRVEDGQATLRQLRRVAREPLQPGAHPLAGVDEQPLPLLVPRGAPLRRPRLAQLLLLGAPLLALLPPALALLAQRRLGVRGAALAGRTRAQRGELRVDLLALLDLLGRRRGQALGHRPEPVDAHPLEHPVQVRAGDAPVELLLVVVHHRGSRPAAGRGDRGWRGTTRSNLRTTSDVLVPL